jgi:hypothetical protein
LGHRGASHDKINTLIQEYLHLKVYASTPVETYLTSYDELSNKLSRTNLELAHSITQFIASVIYPHYLKTEDLQMHTYQLTKYETQLVSLKKLLEIKQFNDFHLNQANREEQKRVHESHLLRRLEEKADDGLKYLIKINKITDPTF